jgi:hypothetical protein
MKISQPARSEVIEMLHQTLATVIKLKTPIKQAQRNQQINFYQPQAIYDEIVAIAEEYIDFFATLTVALSRANTKIDYLKSCMDYPQGSSSQFAMSISNFLSYNSHQTLKYT